MIWRRLEENMAQITRTWSVGGFDAGEAVWRLQVSADVE